MIRRRERWGKEREREGKTDSVLNRLSKHEGQGRMPTFRLMRGSFRLDLFLAGARGVGRTNDAPPATAVPQPVFYPMGSHNDRLFLYSRITVDQVIFPARPSASGEGSKEQSMSMSNRLRNVPQGMKWRSVLLKKANRNLALHLDFVIREGKTDKTRLMSNLFKSLMSPGRIAVCVAMSNENLTLKD